MKITDNAAAPTYSLVGDVYALLLTGDDTGGAFSLTHALVPPGGGPPFHVHEREDETFYILEGEITVFVDGSERTAGPGAAVHLERGSTHRFENRTQAPARMLIHTAPAGFEVMIKEAGVEIEPGAAEALPFGPEDLPRLVEACMRAGIRIVH